MNPSQTYLQELTSVAAELSRAINGRELFVSAVLDRVQAASGYHPHDGAIRTLQFVLEKRAAAEGSLATISQSELGELYSELGSLGNREVFQDSLGDLLLQSAPVELQTSLAGQYISSVRGSGEEIQLTDPSASEALYGLFDDQPLQAALGSFVDNGRVGIELELRAMGFARPDVEIAARNGDFVIYAASIGSASGQVSAYIPAEIKLGSVLMPSCFVSGDEFVELTSENLQAHAQAVASGGRSASAHAILNSLTKQAGKQVELEKLADFGDGSIAMSVPELYMDRVEPEMIFDAAPDQVAMPAELQHLTEGQIRDVLAESGLSHDRQVVVAAKAAVASDLQAAGVRYTNISIASEFSGGLLVSANIVGKGGHKSIEVPVEIINGRVCAPSVFTAGAMARPFDQETLVAFAADEGAGAFDPIMSNKYGMTFKELHNLMLRNAAYGNFVEVEESLAVIGEQYGDQFHRAAHDDLLSLLAVGYGSEEQPMDAMEKFVVEASARAKNKENYIHVQSTAAMLYPKT